jgi:hypothetical protein
MFFRQGSFVRYTRRGLHFISSCLLLVASFLSLFCRLFFFIAYKAFSIRNISQRIPGRSQNEFPGLTRYWNVLTTVLVVIVPFRDFAPVPRFLPLVEAPLEFTLQSRLGRPAYFLLILRGILETVPSSCDVVLENKKKSQGGQIGWLSRLDDHSHVFIDQNLPLLLFGLRESSACFTGTHRTKGLGWYSVRLPWRVCEIFSVFASVWPVVRLLELCHKSSAEAQ